MLSDQDTGFENKARVRKLPLQVFTAPDAQKPETEKQNKKETEASLNADNDTYNGLECSQEQIELGLREKENILDMAAAPGGKTTQISAISSGKSYITACEKNKIRCDRLKYNLQKQGVGNVNVMQEDARKLSDFFSFDKILLDAPCSGSGTESLFNQKFTEELIQRSAKTQEELLTKALKILKKDGEMVYSTCSILKEENEKVLNKVLKKFNAKIVPIEKIEGIEYLPVEIEGTLCILPTELYEGFFVAKIRK